MSEPETGEAVVPTVADSAERADTGADPATVAAAGKISEALETVERARGHLYTFHQLSGTADFALGEGCAMLRDAGHATMADRLERELVGRNVLRDRWTFQLVEEYDDGYWSTFRSLEREVREALVGGRRHVFEAQLKEDRRTPGHPAHTTGPTDQTADRPADDAAGA